MTVSIAPSTDRTPHRKRQIIECESALTTFEFLKVFCEQRKQIAGGNSLLARPADEFGRCMIDHRLICANELGIDRLAVVAVFACSDLARQAIVKKRLPIPRLCLQAVLPMRVGETFSGTAGSVHKRVDRLRQL